MQAARIIPPTCSCDNQLGAIQFRFEQLTASGLSLTDACTALGFMKMCCRNQIQNCPLYFITSTDKGRICDRTGLITGETKDVIFNGPLCKLMGKEAPPPFPALPNSFVFKETSVASVPPTQQLQLKPLSSMSTYLTPQGPTTILAGLLPGLTDLSSEENGEETLVSPPESPVGSPVGSPSSRSEDLL